MTILVDRNTRVLVQGITGKIGAFHTQEMIQYGTHVVGGVTPGKGGTRQGGVQVFDTVKQAVDETGATASIVFVPPPLRSWKRPMPGSSSASPSPTAYRRRT
jgi:succinyl-CoA synthetase alpha subunit